MNNMARNIKSSVSALAKELRANIAELERDLAEKRGVLSALEQVYGGGTRKSTNGRRVTSAARKPRASRGGGPKRRRSKNRDIVINAASALGGNFTLQELLHKIRAKNPGFGGKYPSSTLITVIRTTPAVKKVRRGQYKYAG